MIHAVNTINTQNFSQKPKSKKKQNSNVSKYIVPLVGSSIGVAAGYFATKKVNLKSQSRILDELVHLLAMAGGANIGSVVLSSIDKKPKQINKKIREAAFQMMNTTIPMLMVAGANAICNKTIGKSKPVVRIIASILAMAGGAILATKISNTVKPVREPKRKYTIKDSIANIDDLIATFSIGFEEKAELLKLDTRLIPFVYAYCGMRAGAKE